LIFAFIFKIISGIGYSAIFDFYYHWAGDTYSYFINATKLGEVLFENPSDYFKMFFGQINKENVYELSPTTYYQPYFRDPAVFATHRFLSFFTIIGLKNYYLVTICLNTFLFILLWKFYRFLTDIFPDKHRIIALSVLFIPSVGFWSSGLIKDPFTYTFALTFIKYFYILFYKRKLSLKGIILILLSAYVIVELKPYILYAIIISGFVWIGFSYIKLVKNKTLRVLVLPITILAIGFSGFFIMNNLMATVGGAYGSVDKMIGKASGSQQDLKQDYYKGSSFDIGDYDATVQGAASVTPAAIIAGLYRPFLWEANSIVMILSGLENLILLFLTIYVLFRAGPIFFFKQLSKEPFLIFCFIFSLIMAMGIGLSTANFGALVRFKIPLIPFFLMGWLFVLDEYRKKKGLKEV